MKRFFRKLRAVKYALEAWALWEEGVKVKLDKLSQTDDQIRQFRNAIDAGWQIIRFGKVRDKGL